MNFFKKIINSLINESVPSINNVNDAINRTYEVEINYHTNGEDEATGRRIIQPHAYGLTKSGNPVIRAFQPYGDTTTKIPSWKFFRVDRIDSWKPFPERIFREAPGSFHADGIFNKNGDKTMSTVYNIAKFKDDVYRTDTERGINNLKKQLENPKNIKNQTLSTGPIKKSEIEQPNLNNNNKQNNATQEPELYKTDTERGMENLKKQLENPKYLSDVIKSNKLKNQEVSSGPIKKDDSLNNDEENNEIIN